MKLKNALINTAFLFLVYFAAAATAAPTRLEVYLDPGHGGEDTGAVAASDGTLYTEKDITLEIAKKTRDLLKAKKITAFLTRNDDQVVPLDTRTALTQKRAKARGVKPVFVSIHLNSNADPSASGIETYVFNATTNEASSRLAEVENGSFRVHQKGVLGMILSDLTASANYGESVSLACAVQRSLALETEALREATSSQIFKNRGVKKGLFYVLMDAQAPSILIELGFLSNKLEREALKTPQVQDQIARALVTGILNWVHPQDRATLMLAASGIQKQPKLRDQVSCM